MVWVIRLKTKSVIDLRMHKSSNNNMFEYVKWCVHMFSIVGADLVFARLSLRADQESQAHPQFIHNSASETGFIDRFRNNGGKLIVYKGHGKKIIVPSSAQI